MTKFLLRPGHLTKIFFQCRKRSLNPAKCRKLISMNFLSKKGIVPAFCRISSTKKTSNLAFDRDVEGCVLGRGSWVLTKAVETLSTSSLIGTVLYDNSENIIGKKEAKN